MWFLEGHTYDVSESLSAIFLKEGWAEEVVLVVLPVAESAKAEMVAPAHKQEYRRKR